MWLQCLDTVGWAAGNPACKKLSGGSSWCHCHSLSLTSVKSGLILPFCYPLNQAVPLDKRPLNACCLFITVVNLVFIFLLQRQYLSWFKEKTRLVRNCLPHRRIDFVFPLGVDKLDEKCADDYDHRTESVSEHVQKHAAHVELRAGLYTSNVQHSILDTSSVYVQPG